MCGIAGLLSRGGAVPDQALVRRMTDALRHRGPDDEGYFAERGVALGFRRLSIVDLAGGHQPMASACGRFTIVFNGEIYNYRELRARLERDHGSVFRTTSDTEVILEARRHWGEDAVSRLNGMFAFAIWDSQTQELLLARDRMGKKPLYYATTASGLSFASEVKALLLHPEVSAAVAAERVPTFLTYRYVPGEETLFRDVHCLPAASVMTARDGAAGAPRRYWDYTFGAPARSSDPASLAGELHDLLSDSVRLRMIADVPVGAFLSGGIDSSLIVAMMARQHGGRLATFSIGFDTGMTETAFARTVAERYGTEHHEIVVGSDELVATIPAVLHARETPITEASDIPLYLLSRLARSRVKVVLSGEGSDEVLAGYPKYAFERLLARAPFAPPRGLLSAAAAVLPFRSRRLQLALECAAERDCLERYAGWFGAFPPGQRRRLLSPELPAADHAFSREALAGKPFASPVEQMLYLDTRHWLPANLLLRGDRMSMAHSLELRCPFLDPRIVELAAGRIPLGLKLRGFSGKHILKRVARPLVPDEVLRRPKWGFKVPLAEWFRGRLAPVLGDVLLSPRALGRGYFREQRLRELVDEHLRGQVNHEKQLWILLQLELWHLMFVDRTLSPADALR